MEEILPYKCTCGGTMKKSRSNLEFFGIDFGLKPIEVCTKCGEEYVSDRVMEEVEKECKKMGIFGLERKVRVTKSGNSLVIRIPPEIAKFVNVKYQDLLSIMPVGKGRIEVQIV